MSLLEHEGLSFRYRVRGEGKPLVMLHGLGGDLTQPLGLLKGLPGIRLITLDFRAHGETLPLGAEEQITMAQYADDVRALFDRLSLRTCVLGGISLGAAVALRFALRFSDRLQGLILSRPAWLAGPNPFNVRVYSEIARLIRERGAAQGKEIFGHSGTYAGVLQQSSDAARSLLGQFDSPRAEDAVCRLERLPTDSPIQSLSELASLKTTTLVLANRCDPIHPCSYGEVLGRALPHATFGELTPKSVSVEQHATDFRRFVSEFMDHLTSEVSSPC